MNVLIGQSRVRLDDKDLLGVGGEGRVYAWGDLAVKVYHDDCAHRAMALAKVAAFPASLPPEVVAPRDVVRNERGEAVGFTMPVVRQGTEATRLSQRKWRDGNVSSHDVVLLFRRVHATIRALHARGVVCGDFNDGNVLFVGGAPRLIDCDSMQLGGYPCAVAHERFLDPRLYGKDLALRPAFTEESDWYAFAVMLFASLLYVHPYGGTHARYPTLLRRAEARHSVLRADVVYPRSALHFRTLPDDFLHFAERVFDGDARGVFPEGLLAMQFRRCACGVEHAHAACPECSAPRMAMVARAEGKCRALVVRRTRGRIVSARIEGGLRYVFEEDGIRYHQDGTRVLDEDPALAPRFAVDGDFIVDTARGTRVGQVLAGQTWLAVGSDVGFGFYRTGSIVQHFTFSTERGGMKRVVLPPVRGKLVDCAAAFDKGRALFTTAVDAAGKRIHATYLVEDGEVIASASGSPEDHPMLASVSGKCLAYGAILCPSDDGLVLVRADTKTRELVPAKVFTETAPFVSQASELLPGPRGSVYVLSSNQIVQLSLA